MTKRLDRKRDSRGYVIVYRPGHHRATKKGYVKEHILVMEETLGRPIMENEIIHHINGKPWDNRPENLQIVTAAWHYNHHLMARWAEGTPDGPFALPRVAALNYHKR